MPKRRGDRLHVGSSTQDAESGAQDMAGSAAVSRNADPALDARKADRLVSLDEIALRVMRITASAEQREKDVVVDLAAYRDRQMEAARRKRLQVCSSWFSRAATT